MICCVKKILLNQILNEQLRSYISNPLWQLTKSGMKMIFVIDGIRNPYEQHEVK
jgi:hypothetical protein